MGLLDTLRERLPGLDSRPGADGETFAYRCRDCGHEFESPHRHVTDASCPSCGAEDVRVQNNPYLDDS